MTRARVDTGVSRQLANAALALATASSNSVGVQWGTRDTSSCVAGLRTSEKVVEVEVRNLPSMSIFVTGGASSAPADGDDAEGSAADENVARGTMKEEGEEGGGGIGEEEEEEEEEEASVVKVNTLLVEPDNVETEKRRCDESQRETTGDPATPTRNPKPIASCGLRNTETQCAQLWARA